MLKPAKNALILFAHGSRNANWREPFEKIRQKVSSQTKAPVRLAFLELMLPTLPDTLQSLTEQKITHITIVPLFFGLGNHVAHDLQTLINSFSLRHPNIEVKLSPPLGESEEVLNTMALYANQALID